jgi:hypothetical protein
LNAHGLGTSLILTKVWSENLKGRDTTDNKWNFEGTETNLKVARKFSPVMIRPIIRNLQKKFVSL